MMNAKLPPYISEVIEKIQNMNKIPGTWNLIHKALLTYHNLIRWDAAGWRFYAVKKNKEEIEIGSLINWSFAKWDEEDEIQAINEEEK